MMRRCERFHTVTTDGEGGYVCSHPEHTAKRVVDVIAGTLVWERDGDE